MSDRVDAYLQGTVALDALSSGERASVDAVERAILQTDAFLGARQAPDLGGRVMRRVEQLDRQASRPARGLLRRVAISLWVPRQIAVRPAYALMAVATCAALQFRLNTQASSVRLADSFTNWEPRYELREAAPGIWTITVPLSGGVHDYAFLVDDQRWLADPYAFQISDGFGGTTSRLALLPTEVGRL